jgi:hypothetical protein
MPVIPRCGPRFYPCTPNPAGHRFRRANSREGGCVPGPWISLLMLNAVDAPDWWGNFGMVFVKPNAIRPAATVARGRSACPESLAHFGFVPARSLGRSGTGERVPRNPPPRQPVIHGRPGTPAAKFGGGVGGTGTGRARRFKPSRRKCNPL